MGSNKRHMCMNTRRLAMTCAHASPSPSPPPWMAPKLLSDKSTKASDHLHAFQKLKHLLWSEVRWCVHRLAKTQKEAFSEVRVHAGTTQVDFEVDLMNWQKKKTVRKNVKSMTKIVRVSREADSCEKSIDCEIACDHAVGLCEEIFAWTHTANHTQTSTQCINVNRVTSNNRLWSPKVYGLTGKTLYYVRVQLWKILLWQYKTVCIWVCKFFTPLQVVQHVYAIQGFWPFSKNSKSVTPIIS